MDNSGKKATLRAADLSVLRRAWGWVLLGTLAFVAQLMWLWNEASKGTGSLAIVLLVFEFIAVIVAVFSAVKRYPFAGGREDPGPNG